MPNEKSKTAQSKKENKVSSTIERVGKTKKVVKEPMKKYEEAHFVDTNQPVWYHSENS